MVTNEDSVCEDLDLPLEIRQLRIDNLQVVGNIFVESQYYMCFKHTASALCFRSTIFYDFLGKLLYKIPLLGFPKIRLHGVGKMGGVWRQRVFKAQRCRTV